MARKFKVGDKVKVCVPDDEEYGHGYKKGNVGFIVQVKQFAAYRYVVYMKCDNNEAVFKAHELERVK